jgi:hypothetical protein
VRAVEMFGCPEKIKNMPKIMNNSTTINVKEIIFRLRERGVSFTDIAYALDKKEDAVRMMFNRYEFVRDLPQKTIVTARLTDGVIGRQIKAEVKLNRLIKVKDIKFNLEQLYGPSYKIPSETTIREYLNDRMYKLAKASNKQLIHPRNVQKRFEFAVSTIEKPAAYFDRIIWSDKTTVRSHPTKNQLLFWHHSTHPDMQEVINGQVQGGGISAASLPLGLDRLLLSRVVSISQNTLIYWKTTSYHHMRVSETQEVVKVSYLCRITTPVIRPDQSPISSPKRTYLFCNGHHSLHT